ncbi:MAG: hypothetical protein ABIZ09_11855 [Rhodoferax sp.]
MKATLQREKYIAIVLVAAAVMLSGVLIWEWENGLRLERDLLKMQNIPQTPVRALNVLPEFELPPEDTGFSEVISRSLFSVNRRSAAIASKGGVSAMKKGQFLLVGVLITPTQRSALLRDVQTNKVETIALNGLTRGLTVGEVQASRVVLRQGAESEELILNVQTGPKGVVAQRLPAQPPATAAPLPPAPPASAASSPSQPASSSNSAVPHPTGKPMGAVLDPQPPGPARADGKKQP